ncbi:MAG: polysaccharide export protein [Isosphaeraceae bacterium]|nr:polysaccharide export protein [Isosphaeraceae bacterium]
MEGVRRSDQLRSGRLLPLVALLACGCATVRPSGTVALGQKVKIPEERIAASNIPGELRKTTMPEYVIEPPDLIQVEVLEALPGRPITGERLVRPDGTITLGFYGDVFVAGLTMSEAKEKIILHLRKYLKDDVLGLVRPGDPDKGEDPAKFYPVPLKDNDRVFVDVTAYNSKFFYVEGDVAAPGRMPITGNETVLDAINYAGGLIPTAQVNNIRLVRPAPPGACCAQILPVNYQAIVLAGDTTTNYQLMPGDRLYVFRDPIVRGTVFLDRLASPFNTVLNSILIYSFTQRSVESLRTPIFGTGTTGVSRSPGIPANMPPMNTPAR